MLIDQSLNLSTAIRFLNFLKLSTAPKVQKILTRIHSLENLFRIPWHLIHMAFKDQKVNLYN